VHKHNWIEDIYDCFTCCLPKILICIFASFSYKEKRSKWTFQFTVALWYFECCFVCLSVVIFFCTLFMITECVLSQDTALLNVVNLTAVKIVAPVKRLQTKTQVNTATVRLLFCMSYYSACTHRLWLVLSLVGGQSFAFPATKGRHSVAVKDKLAWQS